MHSYIEGSMNEAESSMSNILVVVYSHTGTSHRVAELLCSQQDWPMAEILDARPRRGSSYAARLEAFGAAVRSAKDSRAVVRPVTLSPQAT